MTATVSTRDLLLASLLGLSLSAAPIPLRAIEAKPNRLNLPASQQQKLLPEWRRLSLQATEERIAILQKHRQCLSAAGSLEALQACQRQQRQALISHQRLQQQAMRQMLQRNGITPPASRPEGDSRRPMSPPEGVPMI